VWNEYVAQLGTVRAPFNIYDDWTPASPVPHAANELLDNLATAPVVLVIATDLSKVTMVDKDLGRPTIIGGASVYPFCWSILLAARAHDLGGVLTTFLVRAEHEAAQLLGLQPEHALCAAIVLGHPVKRTTKLSRKPVESFSTLNRFDGHAFPSTQSAT
jgi:Nitroreductase family